MKINSLILLAFLIVTACNQKPGETTDNQTASDTIKPTSDTDYSSFHYVESFKGTLPCADCPGIITEITFVNDNLRYHEANTYIDRHVKNKFSGSYTTDRGYKKDDDATVYVLDDDKVGHERRFLKFNDSTLLMLNQKGEIIDTNSNHKLFSVK